MSLVQALLNRSPLVWVDTAEPEKVIDQLPSLSQSRDIFVFDLFDGLMQWNYDDKSWKIVLTDVEDPNTGEMVETSITHPAHAWGYVFGQSNAVFIVRNAHKDIDDNLTMFSVLYNKYRNAFMEDDFDRLGLQVIALATNEGPPAEIASMCTLVSWGLPTRGELMNIVTRIAENRPGILEGQDTSKIVDASLGLTEFGAIETFLNVIRDTGVLDQKVINDAKFARMKANSDIDIMKPRVTLEQVGGFDNAKALIRKAEWIWKNPEEAKAYGLVPLRRILLLGVSGCGKSYLCEAAAGTLELDLARIGVAKAMNKFVGESERRIESAFAQVNALSPISIWIDEIGRDLSGGDSSGYVDGGTTSRVHATFLSSMQDLNQDVFLFAAANNIDSLAPEMLRADRFDKLLFVGFPSFEERKEIFRLNLNPDVEYDFNAMAAATPCFTGAEIKSLVQTVRFEVSPDQKRHINANDIATAAPKQKNLMWIRHKHAVVDMYAKALDGYEWASSAQQADAKFIAQGKLPTEGVQKVTAVYK